MKLTVKLIQKYIHPETYDTKGELATLLGKRRKLALQYISDVNLSQRKQREIKDDIIQVNKDISNYLGLTLTQ